MIGLNKYHYKPTVHLSRSKSALVLVVVCSLFVLTMGVPTFGTNYRSQYGPHIPPRIPDVNATPTKPTAPGGKIIVKG